MGSPALDVGSPWAQCWCAGAEAVPALGCGALWPLCAGSVLRHCVSRVAVDCGYHCRRDGWNY